ncbi:hypothetical protein N7326_05210 [Corynebacterium sp. ES2794-CONJ1]|uniref:hypothetical protein n=1 Tax=unclassified Corynebacterium TaxID=2624378 RepID=UPI002167AD47|nr:MULTISPECIES: hypothetical protein [unclassified Corynebacterium]MCS4489865.1 hypothetical protein [Corynebacterium sp. ES2775-CONJ]MCS4491771.1 hypothetical protein [Corynebacterium sp. ES2715-CONJ3]MCS4531876.1 hypothetical protein [Corynebacterium sp. ES2730-CONJ]MCU9519273.1 hypothetical protein [Corynebacterium sp. ES2794-CONJ1]
MPSAALKRGIAAIAALSTLGAGYVVGNGYLDPFDFTNNKAASPDRVIIVAVQPHTTEALVLAELYEQALERAGHQAILSLDQSGYYSGVDRLSYGSADLVISCTGTLVQARNSGLAEDLRQRFARDITDPHEQREIVYAAAMSTLLDNTTATDPSNALGCVDSDSGLPEHIMPIYRTSDLDRRSRRAINTVSGVLTTDSLQDIIERAQKVGSAHQAAEEFLDRYSGDFNL